MAESGKTVFAAWLEIPSGGSGTLSLEYENPNRLILKEGKGFRFVFEKQSGVGGILKISVEAPPGFKWRESNKTVFEYKDDNPDKENNFAVNSGKNKVKKNDPGKNRGSKGSLEQYHGFRSAGLGGVIIVRAGGKFPNRADFDHFFFD